MPILNIDTDVTGLAGVLPRAIYILTNDNLATITTAGYLNKSVQNGLSVSNKDSALIYGTDLAGGNPGNQWFQVQISGGVTSLVVSADITFPISVAHGGTGDTSLPAFELIAGGVSGTGTGPLQSIGTGTNGQVLVSAGPGVLPAFQTFAPGGVTSVTGTANRIDVSAGATPVVDIDAAYVGQTSLTTLGTVSTGTWHGALIGPTYGGTGVNNGNSTITIGGNTQFSGAHAFTGVITADTSVVFPTTGTLATTAQLPSFPISPANGGTGINNSTNTLSIGANSSINQNVSTTAVPAFLNANLALVNQTSTTVTLSNVSDYYQYCTGGSVQAVVLPDATTCALGQSFLISNYGEQIITVETFTAVTVWSMPIGGQLLVTCISTAVNTAAAWNVALFGNDPENLTNNVNDTNVVSLLPSQILNMYTTPILVFTPADTAATVFIEKCIIDVIYNSGPYTGGGNIQLQYGNAVHGAGPAATLSLTPSVLYGINQNCTLRLEGYQTNPLNVADSAGQSIYISNDTGVFAGGNCEFVVYLWYSIIEA